MCLVRVNKILRSNQIVAMPEGEEEKGKKVLCILQIFVYMEMMNFIRFRFCRQSSHNDANINKTLYYPYQNI